MSEYTMELGHGDLIRRQTSLSWMTSDNHVSNTQMTSKFSLHTGL